MRKDRAQGRGGGVAIIINQSIKYRIVDNLYNCENKIEVCAVEIFSKGESIFLVACYRPPSMQVISEEDWSKFLNQFDHSKVYFGGDFNAHNPEWGSSHLCHHGKNLGEAISKSNLILLGDNSPTFCGDSYRNPSIVDLSLIHVSLGVRATRRVGSDPWGSDHYPIII